MHKFKYKDGIFTSDPKNEDRSIDTCFSLLFTKMFKSEKEGR